MPWFVKIDDLNGGSTDRAHQGWFEAESFTFNLGAPSVLRPASSGRSVGGPADRRPLELDGKSGETRDALALVKTSPTSGILIQMQNSGTEVKKVFADHVINGQVVEKYQMENVLVSVHMTGMMDHLTFNYTKSKAEFGKSDSRPPSGIRLGG